MKRLLFITLFLAGIQMSYGQLAAFQVQKARFVKTTVDNLITLYENLDEDKWREFMQPFGYLEYGVNERATAIHYTKGNINTYYSVVTFDDQFGVVAILWLDPTGEISVMKDIRKELKGKELMSTSVNTTYQVKGREHTYWITLTSTRTGNKIQEEATIELSRK